MFPGKDTFFSLSHSYLELTSHPEDGFTEDTVNTGEDSLSFGLESGGIKENEFGRECWTTKRCSFTKSGK